MRLTTEHKEYLRESLGFEIEINQIGHELTLRLKDLGFSVQCGVMDKIKSEEDFHKLCEALIDHIFETLDKIEKGELQLEGND